MRSRLSVIFLTAAVIFLSGCDPTSFNNNPNTSGLAPNVSGLPGITTSGQCYQLEENVSFTLTEPGQTRKKYIRLFADAQIQSEKIGDTTRKICNAVTSGDCAPQRGYEVHGYTNRGNWQKQRMENFRLVCLANPCRGTSPSQMVPFDIYVDENFKDSLPLFVSNCQPQGGRVAVAVPPPGMSQNEIPNAFFPKSQINVSPGVSFPLENYYFKIGTTPEIAQEALTIGNIVMEAVIQGISETKTYNVFSHLGTLYLVDTIDTTKIFQYEGTAEIPQPETDVPKSLKLAAVHFVQLSQWNWYTPECKPVIYFYPQKETSISLWLYPRGYLTVSEPEYGNGWQGLLLNKKGEIFYQGKQYPYLHYEAMIGDFKPPQEGFLVAKKELPGFFARILPQVGLNSKEAADFTSYWLGRLVDYPYFQVSPLNLKEIEAIEPMEFSRNPDTFIRVRFYFKGFEESIKLVSPRIEKPPLRNGFTVVEWGGLYRGKDE